MTSDTKYNITFNNACSSRLDNIEMRIAYEVTKRFNQFQDATSTLKNYGHADSAIVDANLDKFISFIAPDFVRYRFITIGGEASFKSISEIKAAYRYFATQLFNSFSQHFSTNPVVEIVPGSGNKLARFTSGGGEYASIFSNAFDPSQPAIPVEQTTISNWDVIWKYENGDWYVYDWTEIGNRIFVFKPPTGPTGLYYQRIYPGAVVEPTIPLPQTLDKPIILAKKQSNKNKKIAK